MRTYAVCAAFLLAACGETDARTYTLTAFESVGVQPDAVGPVIKNASERLPELLTACAIRNSKHVRATDSAFVLEFTADAEQIACLRKSAPPGAEISDVAA